MAIIKVEKEIEISIGENGCCTLLKCDVEVEIEPAEKGYGECPDYPETAGVYSITCNGANITAWFSRETLDELAKEIAQEAIEEGEETKMEYALSMRMAA